MVVGSFPPRFMTLLALSTWLFPVQGIVSLLLDDPKTNLRVVGYHEEIHANIAPLGLSCHAGHCRVS